ncbi:hypothetical protein LTS18_002817 [Coniosporium uncinatum]|uniref:Uncharacterized protein n=1 Tax=Coniosporium uncinatum TaxID=93489 RepID=A0ACC3DUJ6_9PEZI|nr:hypothetical protein LTS18_002817 [Coniosporium uncinatum]
MIIKLSCLTSPCTRVLAGVIVPDTQLITSGLAFARSDSIDYTYNHIIRSFLFSFTIADKFTATQSRDREAQPPYSKILSSDKRFEVDGANAAREFLTRKGQDDQWNKHRLQLVWHAIALHTIRSIVFHEEPEVQTYAYGIWADLQGPARVPGGLLS